MSKLSLPMYRYSQHSILHWTSGHFFTTPYPSLYKGVTSSHQSHIVPVFSAPFSPSLHRHSRHSRLQQVHLPTTGTPIVQAFTTTRNILVHILTQYFYPCTGVHNTHTPCTQVHIPAPMCNMLTPLQLLRPSLYTYSALSPTTLVQSFITLTPTGTDGWRMTVGLFSYLNCVDVSMVYAVLVHGGCMLHSEAGVFCRVDFDWFG